MTVKTGIGALVLFCMICVLFAVFVERAHAQDDLRSEYLGGASRTRPAETAEGPTKLQMGIGIGSIFVMIAVVKWL